MLESKIQSKVLNRLKKNGWLCIKIIQTNFNGIPDAMCLKDGKTVFIEFKQKGKKPRPLQQIRIEQLQNSGFDCYVVDDENFML